MDIKQSPQDNELPMKGRVFIMLQGPQSSFFRDLAAELQLLGAKIYKVNFCGGDAFLWGNGVKGVKTYWYQGKSSNWPLRIRQIYKETKATDLLLYGDCRPLHQDAILLARFFNVLVWVYEEGYLRTGFSTLEREGVNGRSFLPNSYKDVYSESVGLPPFKEARKFKENITYKVKYAIKHHIANVFLFPFFYRYRTHRAYNILIELITILPRYITREKRKLFSAKVLHRFLLDKSPFYFYPLQLNTDTQVQLYSPYNRQEEAITHVIHSFVKHAPANTRLLIKDHPLDNGMIPYHEFIKSMSKALGCEDRITYIDDGNLSLLLDKCLAVVLINSTVGLSALVKNKPVFCLGQSIYAMKGLAMTESTCSLDCFWNKKPKVQALTLENFLRVLKDRALIEGNFYEKEAIDRKSVV